MHFMLHRIRSEELIREADQYRLAQLAKESEPAPRAMAAATPQPPPRRPPP
ncbi:hypothetical protein [Streptomyces sp. NPDC001880]